jgi:hypothetical protein
MARKSNRKRDRQPPVEVPMTDLEAAEHDEGRHHGDSYAAGTPGGGAAAGGLAGTNIGDGDPDNADLEDTMGSGIDDTDGDEAGDLDGLPR